MPDQNRRLGPSESGPLRLSVRVVRAFYLATPLFVVADLGFGLNVRTAFLDATPFLKWVYYVATFAAGVLTWKQPRLTAIVGLSESGLNIALTTLSVGLAYTGLTDFVEDPSMVSPFTAESITGVLVSAAALILSYVASHAALSRERRTHGWS